MRGLEPKLKKSGTRKFSEDRSLTNKVRRDETSNWHSSHVSASSGGGGGGTKIRCE